MRNAVMSTRVWAEYLSTCAPERAEKHVDRKELGMITEHAELPVIPGREAEFEEAFATAITLIAASSGFGGLTLSRCIERPNVYLLLVQWESVEAHNVGFRGSPAYQEWRALLHHFYDPFPTVEHYDQVTSA
jgi:heme-degrading monooxygenase HmoA